MTPQEVKTRFEAGLKPGREDMLWLLNLVETLAKSVRRTVAELSETKCALCHQEFPQHQSECPSALADAALAGNWKLLD